MGIFDKMRELKVKQGGGSRSYPEGEGRGVVKLLTTSYKPNGETSSEAIFALTYEVVAVKTSDKRDGNPIYQAGQVFSWVERVDLIRKATKNKKTGTLDLEIDLTAQGEFAMTRVKAATMAFTGLTSDECDPETIIRFFGATEEFEIDEEHNDEEYAGSLADWNVRQAKSKEGVAKTTKAGDPIYNVYFDIHRS